MDIWISMLEHFAYCPRQCALIHLEQTFDENAYTIRGSLLHDRVHEESSTVEYGIRIERGMPLWSEKLNIHGKSDVVEFHEKTPYPVEYKSGKRMKKIFRNAAFIQLCAQAMCLEDMLNVSVPKGAIFFKGSQRRLEVEFTENLRRATQETIIQVRDLLDVSRIPPPVNDNRCPNCSLIESCRPELSEHQRVNRLFSQLFLSGEK